MKYAIGIEFKGEKHCVRCPLRNKIDDSCNAQEDRIIFNWSEQMKNCPLQLMESSGVEKEVKK